MSDLRAAVEGLTSIRAVQGVRFDNHMVSQERVLALIDAHQCYDEAALAEALHDQYDIALCVTTEGEHEMSPRWWTQTAAAIIARLHEA